MPILFVKLFYTFTYFRENKSGSNLHVPTHNAKPGRGQNIYYLWIIYILVGDPTDL